MANQIMVCLGSCVMFPMECKDDILNLRINTPVPPSLGEIAGIIMRQQKQQRVNFTDPLQDFQDNP